MLGQLLPRRVLPLVLLVVACNAKPCQSEKPPVLPPNDVHVTFSTAIEGEEIVLRYTVVNGKDEPVLILDRMRYWAEPESLASNVLPQKKNWAYVEFVAGTAIIKRQLLEDDSWTDDKERPCGREVPPGGRLEDSLRLSLPLRECTIRGRGAKEFESVGLDEVELRVGWVPKPTFDPGLFPPERVGSDLIWPLSYGWIVRRQQVSGSGRQPVDWAGLAFER